MNSLNPFFPVVHLHPPHATPLTFQPQHPQCPHLQILKLPRPTLLLLPPLPPIQQHLCQELRHPMHPVAVLYHRRLYKVFLLAFL
jgi:hypothetical protein